MIIYVAINMINKKCYVGQTHYSLQFRMAAHKYLSEKGSDKRFHIAIRKYGFTSFKWKTLQIVRKENRLNFCERRWVAYYNSYKNGYNNTEGGDNGFCHSEETKIKIGLASKGKTVSPETRRKMAISKFGNTYGKGHVVTDQTREIFSKVHKGKTISEAHKLAISKAHLGVPGYWTGKKLSKAVRSKISKSLTGKKQTQDVIRKRSLSLMGHICSDVTRNKISKANSGRRNGMYGKPSHNKGKKLQHSQDGSHFYR